MKILDKLTHGKPIMYTDNGPELNSFIFENVMQLWDNRHKTRANLKKYNEEVVFQTT